ncbi:hypothetical protein NL676_022091 [Syzygium grande]|nr:hypothetical protein NL676_022091 [Syzygium grande]
MTKSKSRIGSTPEAPSSARLLCTWTNRHHSVFHHVHLSGPTSRLERERDGKWCPEFLKADCSGGINININTSWSILSRSSLELCLESCRTEELLRFPKGFDSFWVFQGLHILQNAWIFPRSLFVADADCLQSLGNHYLTTRERARLSTFMLVP